MTAASASGEKLRAEGPGDTTLGFGDGGPLSRACRASRADSVDSGTDSDDGRLRSGGGDGTRAARSSGPSTSESAGERTGLTSGEDGGVVREGMACLMNACSSSCPGVVAVSFVTAKQSKW